MKSVIKAPFSGKFQRGFTLMELMVVVVIVAILASVAYPSYTSHVAKSRRASAQTHLMDIAQLEQQYLMDARTYATGAGALAALDVTTPADVSTYYTITVTAVAGPPAGFTATAEPKSGTAQANDGTLSIDNTGLKTPPEKW